MELNMKKTIQALVLSSLVIGCKSKPVKESTAAAAPTSKPTAMTKDVFQEPRFEIQMGGKTVRKETLKNGIKLYFVQDMSLPRVAMSAFYRFGSQQDPRELDGLTSLTSSMLEYGTSKRNATQIADEFGDLGGEFSNSVSFDYSVFEASTLSTKANSLLDLFMDVLTRPTFPENEYKKVREQYLVSIKKRSEDASSYASTKINEFIYNGHPYAREINGTEASVSKIKVQNLKTFFNSYFVPSNLSFVVVGKFDALFQNLVQVKLETIPERKSGELNWVSTTDNMGTRVRVYNKKSAKQTEIRFGHVGLERSHPDFLTMRLANVVLGGGFESRLNQKVRDDLGLTYSISSGIDIRKGRGPFIVSTFTKHETLQKTLAESMKVFNEFVDKGITEKELQSAKNLLKGQFPRALETADKLAFNILLLDHYGVPLSYLNQFNQLIDEITLDQVNAAIRKHMKPNDLRIVILTNLEAVKDQMAPIKDYETIEVP